MDYAGLRFDDVDKNQEVVINMINLGKMVGVISSHGHILDTLEDLAKKPKAELQAILRYLLPNVRNFDDDENWLNQASPCKIKRRTARSAWMTFCTSCLDVQVLRLVLFGKPLELLNSDTMETLPQPGYDRPEIRIMSRYRESLDKISKLANAQFADKENGKM